MYSSEDLERFYFQYQTEALPHGESLQSFCFKNKVPYNIFQKWFIYFQYQTEALPHGESLQSFCVKYKVPYNIFQKCFKDTHKKVVEVQVDGAPVISHEEKTRPVINLNLYQKAVMIIPFAYD